MKLSPGNTRLAAWIMLLLVSLIWGSSFILIKKGLQVFSPSEAGTIRIFVACLVLIPFAIRAFPKIDKTKIPILFFVAAVGSFIPALLFSYAQTNLESALAGAFNSFTPIFVLVIGAAFFKSRVSAVSVVGIFVGLLGCLFIILGGAGFDLAGINLYAFLILAADLMYGTNVNVIKSYLPNVRALHVTAVSFALISPFCGAYLFFGTGFLDKSSVDGFWLALTYLSILGAVNTALAMFIFNNLIKIASPIFAASCTYIIPVVSICWGLWDGEVLNVYQFLGIGIVLAGVYLANKK